MDGEMDEGDVFSLAGCLSSEMMDRARMPPPPTMPGKAPAIPLSDSEPHPAADTKVEWTYGFDDKIQKAFRKPAKNKGAAPEFSEAVYCEEDQAMTDCAKAIFKDGTVWEISSLTKEDWLAMRAGKAAPKRCPPPERPNRAENDKYWKGVHISTGEKTCCEVLEGRATVHPEVQARRWWAREADLPSEVEADGWR